MQIIPGITFRKLPICEGVGSDCKAMLAAVCWNWASIWQHCVWNGLPWLHSWQATVDDDFSVSCVIRGLYIVYRRPGSSQSATDSGRCVLSSELTVSCFLLKMHTYCSKRLKKTVTTRNLVNKHQSATNTLWSRIAWVLFAFFCLAGVIVWRAIHKT